jgi:hypothetical protein
VVVLIDTANRSPASASKTYLSISPRLLIDSEIVSPNEMGISAASDVLIVGKDRIMKDRRIRMVLMKGEVWKCFESEILLDELTWYRAVRSVFGSITLSPSGKLFLQQ